jgi:thiol-disulfide isomerase/thioredoxin
MRKRFLVLVLIICCHFSNGQSVFEDCVQSSFYQKVKDSVYNPNDLVHKWEECVKGKSLPDISVETMTGEKIKPKDLKGKIVVVNLWFIDCLPCIKEVPALNKLAEMYKDRKDVVLLAVTYEKKDRIQRDFLSKYKLDFIIIPEVEKLVNEFGRAGFPTSYVFGKDGKVKAAFLGGPVDETSATEAVRRIKPVVDELLAK